MKPSEFYEKYLRISDGKGGFIQPPKLSDKEKEFMDSAVAKNADFVQFFRKRRRPLQINLGYLQEALRKLPKLFYPTNQPKLDKWGNIIEEPKKIEKGPA